MLGLPPRGCTLARAIVAGTAIVLSIAAPAASSSKIEASNVIYSSEVIHPPADVEHGSGAWSGPIGRVGLFRATPHADLSDYVFTLTTDDRFVPMFFQRTTTLSIPVPQITLFGAESDTGGPTLQFTKYRDHATYQVLQHLARNYNEWLLIESAIGVDRHNYPINTGPFCTPENQALYPFLASLINIFETSEQESLLAWRTASWPDNDLLHAGRIWPLIEESSSPLSRLGPVPSELIINPHADFVFRNCIIDQLRLRLAELPEEEAGAKKTQQIINGEIAHTIAFDWYDVDDQTFKIKISSGLSGLYSLQEYLKQAQSYAMLISEKANRNDFDNVVLKVLSESYRASHEDALLSFKLDLTNTQLWLEAQLESRNSFNVIARRLIPEIQNLKLGSSTDLGRRIFRDRSQNTIEDYILFLQTSATLAPEDNGEVDERLISWLRSDGFLNRLDAMRCAYIDNSAHSPYDKYAFTHMLNSWIDFTELDLSSYSSSTLSVDFVPMPLQYIPIYEGDLCFLQPSAANAASRAELLGLDVAALDNPPQHLFVPEDDWLSDQSKFIDSLRREIGSLNRAPTPSILGSRSLYADVIWANSLDMRLAALLGEYREELRHRIASSRQEFGLSFLELSSATVQTPQYLQWSRPTSKTLPGARVEPPSVVKNPVAFWVETDASINTFPKLMQFEVIVWLRDIEGKDRCLARKNLTGEIVFSFDDFASKCLTFLGRHQLGTESATLYIDGSSSVVNAAKSYVSKWIGENENGAAYLINERYAVVSDKAFIEAASDVYRVLSEFTSSIEVDKVFIEVIP